MKVLHLVASEGSGAGRAALRLHDGLTQSHVDSSVLTLNKSSDQANVFKPSKQVSLYKLAQSRISGAITQKMWGCEDTFSINTSPSLILKDIKAHKPDIINLHWVGWEFIRIEELQHLNTPLVWTLQDMWPMTGGCHYSAECNRYTDSCGACPQVRGTRESDLTRWVWNRKANAWKNLNLTIVAPGTWIADCAKASSLFKQRRLEVIPFCLDTERYQPVDTAVARELLNLPNDKQLILFGAFSATSDQRKGFQLLAPALQRLSQEGWADQVELVVFGSSRPKDPIDLGFKIHYLGRLYDDVSLKLLYSSADVMIVPSLQESFGQTASEALACGTPVVAFNATGLKDIVDHQQNGYLAKPYEVEDLAQGIAWILQDRERHHLLRKSARQKAEQAFHLELQARHYISLYQELLAPSISA